MKRTVIASIALATATFLSFAAHAQVSHDHGAPGTGPQTETKGHDAHCCRPDPADVKGAQDMAGHQHDHSQDQKKPKQKAKKPNADATQNPK